MLPRSTWKLGTRSLSRLSYGLWGESGACSTNPSRGRFDPEQCSRCDNRATRGTLELVDIRSDVAPVHAASLERARHGAIVPTECRGEAERHHIRGADRSRWVVAARSAHDRIAVEHRVRCVLRERPLAGAGARTVHSVLSVEEHIA